MIAALIASAGPLFGATVTIPLIVDTAPRVDPHVKVIAQLMETDKSVSAMADVSVAAPLTLELSPGSWRISATSSDFVRVEQTVTVGTEKLVIPLKLVSAAAIDGAIRQTRETAGLSSLVIRWSPPAPSAAGAPPAGWDECAVDREGAFRCRVPVGRIDYDLHARGFASVFRWSADVPAAGQHLGEVALLPGGSLVGRIQLGAKLKTNRAVRVLISPVDLAARPGDEAHRSATLRNRETVAGRRGFFQFEGLIPGRYRVSASAPPLVSHPVEVDVVGTAEAELRQPLLLGEAKRLRVRLSPELDSMGRPWSVELAAIQEELQRSTIVANRVATSGACEFRSLLPGVYRVTVRQGSHAQWHSEVIDLTDDEDLNVTIPSVVVRGTVRLGEKPIRAVLWFGGDRGQVRVPVTTSVSGQFSVRVPRLDGDVWPEVDIVADQPSLRRSLSNVALSPTEDENTFRLDLELPARAIVGEVVDDEGQPVRRIPVNFTSANDRLVDVLTDDSGSFSYEGLPAGTYSLHAQDGDRESQVVSVTLGESDRAQDVRLVVKDNGRMIVHVTTDFGPVIGARVWIIPVSRSATVVAPVVTDGDGRAEIHFRPRDPEADIAVAAPGLPFTYFRTVARSDAPLEVLLSRGNSLLKIAWEIGGVPVGGPVLHHRGAMLPVVLVNQWATEAALSRDGKTAMLMIASIDPGEYLLCGSAVGAGQGIADCAHGEAGSGDAIFLRPSVK